MICLSIAVRARRWIASPCQNATVLADLLPRPPVMMPAGSGTDGAVVEEQIDVVLRGEKGANVPIEHEVGLDPSLYRLDHLGIGGVDEIAKLPADLLLPGWQSINNRRPGGRDRNCVRRWPSLALHCAFRLPRAARFIAAA